MADIVDPGIEEYLRRLYDDGDTVRGEMEALAARRKFPIVGPLVGRMLEVLVEQAVEPIAAPVQLLLERDHLSASRLGFASGGIEFNARRHRLLDYRLRQMLRQILRQRVESLCKVERIWLGHG